MDMIQTIDNLEDIDFRKIPIGQQFLTMDQKMHQGIPYNIIKISVLSKILFDDVYLFRESHSNIFPCLEETKEDFNYYEDYEVYYMNDGNNFIKKFNNIKESLAKEEEEAEKYDITSAVIDNMYYLINDFKIKIDHLYLYRMFNVHSDHALAIREFKELIKFNQIKYKKQIDNVNKVIRNYLVIPIKNNYLCCFTQNIFNPEEYNWTYNEFYFLINQDLTCYIKINFNKNIINILNDIPKINKSKAFNDFYNFYSINKLDISNYLKDPNILNNICKAFKGVITKDEIEKYFKPVYEDEYITAYLKSKLKQELNIIIKNEDINNEINNQLISNAKRKAHAILNYYKHPTNRHCNIYTGEPIDNSHEIMFKDAGGIIIVRGMNVQYFYTLIDDIYVESTYPEESDIKDRKKIVDTLMA
jgi:hypothetical protein